MARKRISQAELADMLAVSQPAVSRRLSGRVALSVDELVAIANLLNIPLSELVTS